MAKGYWIAFYRSVSNPDAMAAYAKLAGPAIAAAGGRFLARGDAAKAYEAGIAQRVVVIEFDSVEKAVAAHESKATRRRSRCSARPPSGTCASSKAWHNVRSRRPCIAVAGQTRGCERTWRRAMALTAANICNFGWKAREFRLKGVDGKTYTLADVRGPKGTLVTFICNHCPYVRAVIGRLVKEANALEEIGVGTIAIMPNDTDVYREDSFDNMQRLRGSMASPFLT